MKIRIAFGLDLDALPMSEHWKLLDSVVTAIVSFYDDHPGPYTVEMEVEKATGIIKCDFPGKIPADLHVFMCFIPRFDIYRWINVSKDL